MPDDLFYALSFGFGAGIFWRSFFSVSSALTYCIAGIALTCIAAWYFFSKPRLVFLASFFLLAVTIGVLRFGAVDKPAPEEFLKYTNQKISGKGLVIEKPVRIETATTITLLVTNRSVSTRVLISTPTTTVYHYGDTIRFTGKLEKPENFMTDQGKEFDYVSYLKKDDILFVMKRPAIEVLSRGGGSALKRGLYGLSDTLAASLNATLPSDEAALLRGLILGEQASLSEGLRQAFINTGLIHVITISGYHISLVGNWIMDALAFLPKAIGMGAGLTGIFLYIMMTGGAGTAIRAGIMAALALFARAGGRLNSAGRALTLAGVIMVFMNPFILAFDVSFELSCIATLAVIIFPAQIEPYFLWIPWKHLRNMVTTTLGAYGFVLPFVLYKMGNLSLVALPANFAILPLIPFTMGLGIATSVIGAISTSCARIPGFLLLVLLHYEVRALMFFSNLPFSAVIVRDFPFAAMLAVYLVFIYYALRRKHITVALFAVLLTFIIAGALYWRHEATNNAAQDRLATILLSTESGGSESLPDSFAPDERVKTTGCTVRGPLPDHDCTPGAIFSDATVERICIKGYTDEVRNVTLKTRKTVFAEYGISYPVPKGAYEVDHLIPLALGGSNDIANLFPEAAEPTPGFHQKDVVEVYLQGEVCSHRVALPVAQRQIANNWLLVYENLTAEQISAIQKKYASH